MSLFSQIWLRPSTPNRHLVLPGYSLSRVGRPDGSGYGGAAIATKTSITSLALKLAVSPCPKRQLESQWALLTLLREGSERFGIGRGPFRPPYQISKTTNRSDK